MIGHGEKFGRKKEEAIVALLKRHGAIKIGPTGDHVDARSAGYFPPSCLCTAAGAREDIPTRICSTVVLDQGFGFLACSASIQATRDHARLSRLHQNHLNGSARQNGLELKLPPLVLIVIVAALMWVAAYATPMLDFSLPAKSLWSWSLALIGAAVCLSGVVSFRQAKTTVNPTKPDSTSSLVVTGIYRYTRNPMYVGFALVLLGWAVFLSNLVALALVLVFVVYINRFQIQPEERVLSSLFPHDYPAYRARVRRWV